MTKLDIRSAAVAALALGAGLASSSAIAQVRYAAPVEAAPGYVVPVDEVDAVPPNVAGHYTCTFNERRTRLERKNCGGTQFPIGTYGYRTDNR